jgi:predicted nucleic acid-binding protein
MAHYIILSNIIKHHSVTEELWKKHKRYVASYEFINNLKNGKFKNYRCYTSPLALSELINAIYDEFFCQKMYEDGVPYSTWRHIRREKEITSDDIINIENSILDFHDSVVSEYPTKKTIKFLDEFYDLDIISDLILKGECKTQDSILLSTAKHNICSYFVTKDKPLRRTKYKGIKIESPEFFNHSIEVEKK